ncbi:MAG: hypothetical protein KGV59_07250 [Tenacibaculum sp.]|nr:hypothetical protein [Tenacibaculum sp.]
MSFILEKSEKLFNKLRDIYEGHKANMLISKLLVIIFLVTTLISLLVKEEYIYLGALNKYFLNSFFTIELCFVILLMFELLSLVFMLPKSVSKSVGKQLELLSLIFIRGAFKEFSHLRDINDYTFDITNIPDPIVNMMFYALGSLIMFTLLGFTNKLRKHTPITNVEADTLKFIQAKKLVSLFLFLSFLVIVGIDLMAFFNTGTYYPSFRTFYTMLIYSDILIVLIALRYTLNYFKIFRYSAFVVATIFIRLALSLEPYYDVIIGVFTSVFVLLLTATYNYFLKDISTNKLRE